MKPTAFLATFAALTTLLPAASPELRDTGRKLAANYKDSIVWLSVLSKTSMGADGDAPAQLKSALAGQDKEEKSESTGTVVDSSGIILTALAAIDKSSVVDGRTVNTPAGPVKLKASSEVKEIKVITADGTEIPADLVLKDADLGLAFIKVRSESDEAKGVEFKAVDLADSAKGELLDDCIVLGRHGESFNRETSLNATEISGVTTKPRTFYQINGDKIGCPVFLSTGKLLGFSVVRKQSGSTGPDIRIAPVVLPAADIAKVIPQAKEAKATPAADKPAGSKD